MSQIQLFLESKEFSRLIMKGKDQGHLTPEEINDAIPAKTIDFQDIDIVMMQIEKAKIEARKKGHSVTEQQLEDGSIKVVVQIGGAS